MAQLYLCNETILVVSSATEVCLEMLFFQAGPGVGYTKLSGEFSSRTRLALKKSLIVYFFN